MNNHLYNLMTQVIQEQKSLWRIQKHYQSEANSDEEKNFWSKMETDKKEHVSELLGLIKKEL